MYTFKPKLLKKNHEERICLHFSKMAPIRTALCGTREKDTLDALCVSSRAAVEFLNNIGYTLLFFYFPLKPVENHWKRWKKIRNCVFDAKF